MTAKTATAQKELKSVAFAETHGLRDKIVLNAKGTFDVPTDLHESIALAHAGITLDQHKKLQKIEGELLSGVILVAGEQAAQAFKDNIELSEVGISYNIGSTTKASAVFDRVSKDHAVVHVETKFASGELKRVLTHLNGLYDEVNS